MVSKGKSKSACAAGVKEVSEYVDFITPFLNDLTYLSRVDIYMTTTDFLLDLLGTNYCVEIS